MDNTVLSIGGLVAAAVGTVVWWAVRSIHTRQNDFEKDLAAFKLHCAESFVTNSALEKAIDRFSASIDAVFKKLESMESKFDRRLDSKADK